MKQLHADYSKPKANETDWWFPMQNKTVTGWDSAEKYIILYIESIHGDIELFFQKQLDEVPARLLDQEYSKHQLLKYAGQLFEANVITSHEQWPAIYDILQCCVTKVRFYNQVEFGHYMISLIAHNLRKGKYTKSPKGTSNN